PTARDPRCEVVVSRGHDRARGPPAGSGCGLLKAGVGTQPRIRSAPSAHSETGSGRVEKHRLKSVPRGTGLQAVNGAGPYPAGWWFSASGPWAAFGLSR